MWIRMIDFLCVSCNSISASSHFCSNIPVSPSLFHNFIGLSFNYFQKIVRFRSVLSVNWSLMFYVDPKDVSLFQHLHHRFSIATYRTLSSITSSVFNVLWWSEWYTFSVCHLTVFLYLHHSLSGAAYRSLDLFHNSIGLSFNSSISFRFTSESPINVLCGSEWQTFSVCHVSLFQHRLSIATFRSVSSIISSVFNVLCGSEWLTFSVCHLTLFLHLQQHPCLLLSSITSLFFLSIASKFLQLSICKIENYRKGINNFAAVFLVAIFLESLDPWL